MRNSVLLFLVIATLGFSSCCDDDFSSLDLQFKLEYDGEPLVMFDEVMYPDGRAMTFSRFSFYMSELKLNDKSVQDDPDFLNLRDDHSSFEKAQEGLKYTISNIEDSEISKISFKIGLPASINETKPADYKSDNDLSIGEEYWTPWDSYIFSKTEGRIDSDGDGSMETTIALHLGLDEAFRSISLDSAISLAEGSTATADIVIDLKKVFEGSNGIYDIIAVPQIHQTNTMDQINELADNMVEAISVR